MCRAGIATARMGESAAMTELELTALDDAYKAMLIEGFRVYVLDTEARSKWGNGALERLRRHIDHLREARANIVKVMVGDGNEKLV